MTTHAVVIDGYAGWDGVRVAVSAMQTPGEGEVRVAVEAAGVGPWDAMTADGAFASLLEQQGSTASFPMVLGWDFAGTVAEAGPGGDLPVGARVMGMSRQPLTGVGTHAEQITVPAALCIEVPDGLMAVQAATVPCCGLTAWQAVEAAAVAEGDWLLVVGATGQLGGFVTQIAVSRGVRVIASVSAADSEAARQLGAEAVVDREADVPAQVRRLVASGVAAAFDPVGGPATQGAVGSVRDGGAHVTSVTWAKPAQERGIKTTTLFVQEDRAALRALAVMARDGILTPRVSDVVPLADARRAYGLVAEGKATGKVVLDLSR